MGIINKKYDVIGNRRNGIILAQYNTDSRDSLVRRDVAEYLGTVGDLPWPYLVRFEGRHNRLTAHSSCNLDIEIAGARVMHHFLVVDELDEEMIIGADLIRRWKISLDFDSETVTVDPRAESLIHRTGIIIPVPVSGE